MRVLDLFSGIGGFSLGLERAGMKTVAFCEIEPFPRAVLRKHWPEVPIYEDVCTLTAERLAADGIAVDVICGGFPCQDISYAGKGAGLAGERSGLWREYARLIGEIRPRFVIVENVAALLSRGLGDVLADLAALGFDAEWHCIPASALGAHHRRDRIWIVAHALRGREGAPEAEHQPALDAQWNASASRTRRAPVASETGRNGYVADTQRRGLQGRNVECAGPSAIVPPAFGWYRGGREFGETWRVEPNVGRVAYGVPNGMDRLKGLGNAVVPQIPEMIGRAIMQQVTA